MHLSKTLQTAVLSSLCAFSALPAQAATNLLVNGSFETPGYSSIGDRFFASGSTAITGWTAVGPGETQL